MQKFLDKWKKDLSNDEILFLEEMIKKPQINAKASLDCLEKYHTLCLVGALESAKIIMRNIIVYGNFSKVLTAVDMVTSDPSLLMDRITAGIEGLYNFVNSYDKEDDFEKAINIEIKKALDDQITKEEYIASTKKGISSLIEEYRSFEMCFGDMPDKYKNYLASKYCVSLEELDLIVGEKSILKQVVYEDIIDENGKSLVRVNQCFYS